MMRDEDQEEKRSLTLNPAVDLATKERKERRENEF